MVRTATSVMTRLTRRELIVLAAESAALSLLSARRKPTDRVATPLPKSVEEFSAVSPGANPTATKPASTPEVTPTRSEAELVRGPSALAWTERFFEWVDAEPAGNVIRARVTDGEGRAQRFDNRFLLGGIKPNGTEVQHSVAVEVIRML